LNNFLTIVDRLNLWAGTICKWFVALLTLVLTLEVVMRYVFNSPTIWAYDVSYMLGGSFFVLGMGYTLLKNDHVRVDIFYQKYSPRGRAMVDAVLTLVLFLPCFSLLLYHLVPYVYDSWAVSEKSLESFWRPPIYPFKTVLLISVALLLLQGIAVFLRALQVIFSKERA